MINEFLDGPLQMTDPPPPPQRQRTPREMILQALAAGPLSARDLSQRVGLSEREVTRHLRHLQKSLKNSTRRLQLKNAMQAKFEKILLPIADTLIDESQRKHVTFDAFFSNVMFHEVAHGLAIAFDQIEPKERACFLVAPKSQGDKLRESYRADFTFAQAFRQFWNEYLGTYGLVFFDPEDPEIKRLERILPADEFARRREAFSGEEPEPVSSR